MRILRTPALAIGVLLSATTADAQRLPSDSLDVSRRYARWFLAGQTDSLITAMAPAKVPALGGREGIAGRQQQVADNAGREAALIEERFVWRNGKRQYWRTMQMTGMEGHLVLRLVLDHDGKLGGFGISNAGGEPPVDSSGPPIRRP